MTHKEQRRKEKKMIGKIFQVLTNDSFSHGDVDSMAVVTTIVSIFIIKKLVNKIFTPRAEPTEIERAEPTEIERAEPTEIEPAEPTEIERAEPTEIEPAEPTEIERAEPTEIERAEPTEIERLGLQRAEPAEIERAGLTEIPEETSIWVHFLEDSPTPPETDPTEPEDDFTAVISVMERACGVLDRFLKKYPHWGNTNDSDDSDDSDDNEP